MSVQIQDAETQTAPISEGLKKPNYGLRRAVAAIALVGTGFAATAGFKAMTGDGLSEQESQSAQPQTVEQTEAPEPQIDIRNNTVNAEALDRGAASDNAEIKKSPERLAADLKQATMVVWRRDKAAQGNFEQYCLGTKIIVDGKEVVSTAAHCVKEGADGNELSIFEQSYDYQNPIKATDVSDTTPWELALAELGTSPNQADTNYEEPLALSGSIAINLGAQVTDVAYVTPTNASEKFESIRPLTLTKTIPEPGSPALITRVTDDNQLVVSKGEFIGYSQLGRPWASLTTIKLNDTDSHTSMDGGSGGSAYIMNPNGEVAVLTSLRGAVNQSTVTNGEMTAAELAGLMSDISRQTSTKVNPDTDTITYFPSPDENVTRQLTGAL